ncbi:MAG: ribokinase [Clostridia bacterium]|nr:ribokinase [Clostridia bacterium]
MYKNIRCAVVGSINMDLILSADRIPVEGESLPGNNYSYACGGKGANQATGLARLGAKTKMIGKVGDDQNGKKLLDNLKTNGIDTSCVSCEGSQSGLAAIILEKGGKNRIIVFEGANGEIDPDEAADAITDDLDLLLVQFETHNGVVIKAVKSAIDKGIVAVVDCGPAKNFPLEEIQGVTVISPNESETKALTGIYPEDEKSMIEASKILLQRSKAKYAVLKLGERGCSVYDGKDLRILPAYESEVVDTTAAGDSFTAAMALELIRSGDIYSACDIGNKAGSIAVSRMGADASMPTADEILNIRR